MAAITYGVALWNGDRKAGSVHNLLILTLPGILSLESLLVPIKGVHEPIALKIRDMPMPLDKIEYSLPIQIYDGCRPL
jgi:hypothetical protein